MDELSKILIVDDERFNINVLADLLKPHYKIMAAINGQQALKAARSAKPPDLILLDVMMPELDGYEVCRQLKADESTREIPIIFVTAMSQVSDETKGLDLGAADYITKPISAAIVEARVKTQLERKQHLDDLQKAHAIINSQKERMEEELNVGRDIQLSMLPQEFPAFPDHDEFTVHASMEAAREVGGDFYDFYLLDEDHLCFCVGDVSGKGVPAALFMTISKALIKSRAADDLSTASIVTHVNEELAADNQAMMFVTVFLGILEIRSGRFVFTNAGHNPPYIRRSNGEIERLAERHGPVVGPLGGFAFKEDESSLSKGDSLIVFSDGVTEAMDSERALYGEDRLVRLLQSTGSHRPEPLIRAISADVEAFADGAEQSDDITLLALSFDQAPAVDRADQGRFTMKNQLADMDQVITDFECFAAERELPSDSVQKVKVALDELLNNIVSYGFPDRAEHEIEIKVARVDQRLTVTISDDGVPFNPFQKATPDLTSSLEERDIGGLGIHLVRELMDSVSYKRGVNRNIVTLVKSLVPQT